MSLEALSDAKSDTQVPRSMRLLLLTALALMASTSGQAKTTLNTRDQHKALQFVKEATAIINRQVRDSVRNILLYCDGDRGDIQDLLSRSLHSLSVPVYVMNQGVHWETSSPRQSTAFIILSDSGDVDTYMSHLQHVSSHPAWTSWSQVIFVHADLTEGHTDISYPLLKASWIKYETIESLVIYKHSNQSNSLKFCITKRFDPFVSEGRMVEVKNSKKFHAKSQFDGMGYPVLCTVRHFPPFSSEVTDSNGIKKLGGISGTILDIIARSMNINVVCERSFLRDTSKWVLPNTFYNTVDIPYPFAVLQSNVLKVTSYPYRIEKVVLVVPKADQIPSWMCAILPFDIHLWVLYLSSCFVLFVLGMVYSHFRGDNFRSSFLGLEIFRLYFLGMSQHRVTHTGLRLCICSVMLFNIVLNNAYSGSFTSYLTVPQYYSDINTVADLKASGLPIGFPPQIESDTIIDLDGYMSEVDLEDDISLLLLSQLVPIGSLKEGVFNARTHRNLSVTYFLTGARLELSKLQNFQDNWPLLHIMRQNILTMYLVTVFRVNFPLLATSDSSVWYIKESGILNKIFRKDFERDLTRSLESNEDAGRLELEHLKTFFYVLIFGYILSISIFGLEITFFFC